MLALSFAQRLVLWLLSLASGGLAVWVGRRREPGWPRAAVALPLVVVNHTFAAVLFDGDQELVSNVSAFIAACVTTMKARVTWCTAGHEEGSVGVSAGCAAAPFGPGAANRLLPPLLLLAAGGVGPQPRQPDAAPHKGPVCSRLCSAHHPCRRRAKDCCPGCSLRAPLPGSRTTLPGLHVPAGPPEHGWQRNDPQIKRRRSAPAAEARSGGQGHTAVLQDSRSSIPVNLPCADAAAPPLCPPAALTYLRLFLRKALALAAVVGLYQRYAASLPHALLLPLQGEPQPAGLPLLLCRVLPLRCRPAPARCC